MSVAGGFNVFILGIAGGTGSGKTTIAENVIAALPKGAGVLIESDAYYRDRSGLPRAEREHINYDHPDAIETEFLAAQLVALRAVMSSVEIIVPPGLAVETEGTAIMGTFEHVDRAPAHPDPEAPLLRVHGLALMGSVEIKMRLPGESEREAHRRLKQERRDRKALPGR